MNGFDPGQPLPDKPPVTRAAFRIMRIGAVIMAVLAAGVLWVAALAVIWLTKAVLG